MYVENLYCRCKNIWVMLAAWKFTQACKFMQSLFQLMNNFSTTLKYRENKCVNLHV